MALVQRLVVCFCAVTVPGSLRQLTGRAAYDPYGNVAYSTPGDGNFDGVRANNDIFIFLNKYFAGARFADFDFNGELQPNDIFTFLNGYFANPVVPPGLVSAACSANSPLLDGNLVPDSAIGYAGYLLDPETGLYLARHRAYDPATGRWLQRDPAGYVDGMNLYQYVGSSPMTATDPLGLFNPDTIGGAARIRALGLSAESSAEIGYHNHAPNLTAALADLPGIRRGIVDTMADRALTYELNTNGGNPGDVTTLGLARNIFLEQATGVADAVVAIEGVDLSEQEGVPCDVEGLDRWGAGFRGFGGLLGTGAGGYASLQSLAARTAARMPAAGRAFFQRPMSDVFGSLSRFGPSERAARASLTAQEAATPGGHFWSRHGVEVPNSRMARRAMTGELPDQPGVFNRRPTDSSKWFSARRQQDAMALGPSGSTGQRWGWGYVAGDRYPRFGSGFRVYPETNFPFVKTGSPFGRPQFPVPPLLNPTTGLEVGR